MLAKFLLEVGSHNIREVDSDYVLSSYLKDLVYSLNVRSILDEQNLRIKFRIDAAQG